MRTTIQMLQPKPHKIDKFFLLSASFLTIAGFIIFLSASLGLLAQSGVSFVSVALKQSISLVIGVIIFYIFSRINYAYFRKWAFFILLGAIFLNLLLFIPGVALHANGASRWIDLGFLTFQPSEFLKIAVIIYLASFAYFAKDKIATLKLGLAPYIAIISILGILLFAQRDTDTFVIIAATGLAIFFIAGLKIKHIVLSAILLCFLVGGVILSRDYALTRVKTYLNRGSDAQGSGYQINQSLIAIGSGQIAGRGFGQSIQKFGYLPQPTDDSIFAVAAEEFGFIGSFILICAYLLFAVSIFRIATKASDIFGSLLAAGIGILIITESFMNMAAMLGIIPLSGMPLLFVSHGGTALIISLMIAGIVANISKFTRAAHA